jgi:hypothetical protein
VSAASRSLTVTPDAKTLAATGAQIEELTQRRAELADRSAQLARDVTRRRRDVAQQIADGATSDKTATVRQALAAAIEEESGTTAAIALLDKQIDSLKRQGGLIEIALAEQSLEAAEERSRAALADVDARLRDMITTTVLPAAVKRREAEGRTTSAWGKLQQARRRAGLDPMPAANDPTNRQWLGYPDLADVVELLANYVTGRTRLQAVSGRAFDRVQVGTRPVDLTGRVASEAPAAKEAANHG